jgi:hypothetical protein
MPSLVNHQVPAKLALRGPRKTIGEKKLMAQARELHEPTSHGTDACPHSIFEKRKIRASKEKLEELLKHNGYTRRDEHGCYLLPDGSTYVRDTSIYG